MYSQSSVRLSSSEGRRALLLQTSAHCQRGQTGGWLVSTSTRSSLPVCVRVSVTWRGALVNQYTLSRWRGDYGGRKQLWFPANYVEELPSSPVRELDEAVSSASDHVSSFCIFKHHQSPRCIRSSQSTENSPLGTFLKGFIDVTSCHVGEFKISSSCSLENIGINLPLSFCLCSGAQGREELAALRVHHSLPALLLPPSSESGCVR